MARSAVIILLYAGFGYFDLCSGLPVDFSSVGTGKLNAVWLTNSLLLAVGFLIGIVSLIIGCICCRNGRGFKQNEAKAVEEFTNSNGCLSNVAVDGFVNPSASSEITIFPPYGVTSNVSSRSSVVHFEPLPNIKPQPPNLRPAAFSYSEQEISSQDWFYDPYNNFPRNQLKYLQEYGKGWFGRVVEGEAQNIVGNEKLTKVIVKMLHEDATPTDQMYFLHEVKFYRDLKHPNILNLLGRCLETEPFLILLESCPNGDLKSFLTQNMASAQALVEQGVTLRMCCNITSGLQYMHENKFIHTDLAARNCLVTPDLTVKIGDYGNSIEIFKSDYYCAGSVALPVRWCAPETLKCTDVTIETREVTPVANVWTLAVVIWEICEFCKLPYEDLNDDEVIVRVLGEKNYFLQIPKMLCLYKDELYHLMKLCWSQPLQRPTASQIGVILGNLLSSYKGIDKQGLDPKRFSQDFEQRWQKSKPNYIPKKDDAVEVDDGFHSTNTIMFKGAKVADSSYIDSPLVIFMSHKNKLQDSPRFRLKAEKTKDTKNNIDVCVSDSDILDSKSSNYETEEEYFNGLKKSDSIKNLTGSLDRLNIVAQELQDKSFKGDFDFRSEINPLETVNSDYKATNAEIDSWLKGVEVNNEEDETFVRKISEAIRDLDAALAMEKTSSSEENSGKSSHQNSPGKETKDHEDPVVVDFKLGVDTSTSFINFIPKSFELSSLQNSEEPQSLNFNNSISVEKANYFPSNSIFDGHSSMVSDAKNSIKLKNNIFDESFKGNESFLNLQSRNSSDTEDEIWRRRIEKGEFSEKVKEKSKSIANLMILTHIEASDDSDVDLDRSLDRSLNRNSYNRRHYSNPKSSLSSNNCGSENDLTNAVLKDNFEESLRKLSNDHKEYGRFDSLGMILPAAVDRENLWGTIIKKSNSDENLFGAMNSVAAEKGYSKTVEKSCRIADPSEMVHKSDALEEKLNNHNNFLGNTASEKLDNASIDEKLSRISASSIVIASDIGDCLSPTTVSGVEHGLDCDSNNGSNYENKILHGSSQTNDSNESKKLEENVIKEDLVKGISANGTMHSSYLQFTNDESHDFVLTCDTHESKDNHNNLKKNCAECNDKLTMQGMSLDKTTAHANFAEIGNDKNISTVMLSKAEDRIQDSALADREKEKMEMRSVESGSNDFSDLKGSRPSESSESNVNDAFLQQAIRDKEVSIEIPEIKITEANNVIPVEDESDEVKITVPKVRPFRFIIKEDFDCPKKRCELPKKNTDFESEHTETSGIAPDLKKNEEMIKNAADCSSAATKWCVAEDVKTTSAISSSIQPVGVPNKKERNIVQNVGENVHVIMGACEDYTLDYFKGLKTNFGEEENANKNTLKDLSEVTISKDLNLEIWDKHLEKSITQKIDNTNFDEINFSFFNVSLESSEKNAQSDAHNITSDNSISTSPSTSLSNVEGEENSMKEKKSDDHLQSNGFTNLNGNTSEEEYDNNKLRTPDDERSSDSGFRDKGSLSESVEDACEGKYNLEDIEAELEEAYATGSFNGCDMEKEKDSLNMSQTNKSFEYMDAKFYEDENKMEEDFSDVDGEIEFWQSRENSDYYREISEFNTADSGGWYLHPPDENFYVSNAAVDEEFVNILRNELRQKLPNQTRTFREFSEDYNNFEGENTEDDKGVRYFGSFSAALSPILEEQDSASAGVAKPEKSDAIVQSFNENAGQKCRRPASNVMEANKFVDTNAFMHYLDYMVETEGKSKHAWNGEMGVSHDIGNSERMEVAGERIPEELPQGVHTTVSAEEGDRIPGEEPTNGVDRRNAKIISFESSSVLDDIMVVNTDTNEITLLEFGGVQLGEKRRGSDANFGMVDEDLVYSPDSYSPERDRSLSDPSRSSNGSQGEDIPSETFSSSDALSECYLTPTSEKSPFDSPPHSQSTASQEDEAEPKARQGAPGTREAAPEGSPRGSELEADAHFAGGECCCSAADADAHEMFTSFMGDSASDEGNDVEEVPAAAETGDGATCDSAKERTLFPKNADGGVNEWESFSSGGEDEMSSSSGEFIWKDGDKESKVKVKHVSDGGGDGDEEFLQDSESENVQDCESAFQTKLRDQIENYNAAKELGEASKDDNCNSESNEFEENAEFTDSEDDRDGSSTGSSASITDFVPSAWNSQAMPSRPALRSPDKKSENQKRNVWFKKQKYHCVYEYPREPSDSESANNSPQRHFTYEIDPSEVSNKYFPYGMNNKMNLKNKYFTYGVSDIIGYSNYVDWDPVEGNDADVASENDSADDCCHKEMKKTSPLRDNNYYNLNSFDYDFNNSNLNNDHEFFISSSARPFQGSSLSQFFPSNSNRFSMFKVVQTPDDFKPESDACRAQDFMTPDSGVEDSSNATPTKKTDCGDAKSELLSPKSDEVNETEKDSVNVLENLNFSFDNKSSDVAELALNDGSGWNTSFIPGSNSPAASASPVGLGELRHARDKLKLNLPTNHNIDLDVTLGKTAVKIDEVEQNGEIERVKQ